LEAIRISEKINDFENLHSANNGIGNTYSNENPRKALIYHWKAKELAEKIGNQDGVTQVLYNIGGDYRKLKVYDSAKMYTMMSFDKASALKSHRMMGPPLYGMGMIYTATDQLSLALEHFRTGASYCVSAKNYNHLSRIYQGMAYAFNKLGQTDSTLIYAKLALSISRESHFIGRIPPLADVIYDAYKRLGNKDSALAYVEMSKIFKDSAHIEENQKHMQALTAEEYVRQQEKAEDDLKTNEERRRNIQYAAIALALLVFIILFLLLSHSVVANQKLIRFLGIMALLLVFEFLNLLLHPYVGTLTHHSPFLMLAIMVAIGALLIPIHHKLEKVIIDRLVEKNKKIRLNAAKKTISKLENLNS
jgi:tetratricopeptide (TPR) repeat protein